MIQNHTQPDDSDSGAHNSTSYIVIGLLAAASIFFAIATVAILFWPSSPADAPAPLPPAEAILQEFLPKDSAGPLQHLAWASLQDGVWDTRTVSISTAGPELRGVLTAIGERLHGDARLPEGRAILVITEWQADLKKVTLRLFWQGENGQEQALGRTVYLHRETVGLEDEQPIDETPPASAGRSIASGAKIYDEDCANCHGVAGSGIPGIAPPLDDPQFFAQRMDELNDPGDLHGFVRGAAAAGRPALFESDYDSEMEAWASAFGGSLTAEEVDDVTSFIVNWHLATEPADPVEAVTTADGIPAQGQAFFGSLDCLGCHGWPNQGGITGPDLAGVARRKSESKLDLNGEGNIRISLLAPSASTADNCPTGPCPDMMPRDYGSRLSPLEIEQLVRFMLTLTDASNYQPHAGAPPPLLGGLATTLTDPTLDSLERGRMLYEDHCVSCHGVQGQGALATGLEAVLASDYPQEYARAATAQGVPGIMPAWDQQLGGPLPDADLDDVAAYVVEMLQSAQ